MDILKPSAGSFLFMGEPPSAAMRRRVGTLLETPNFYHYLSAERNLRIAAEIKGKGFEQIPSVLQKVNLYHRKDSKFSTYSLGMKQRLAIASCLLGDPDVLVFDEPTNGLDIISKSQFRKILAQALDEERCVIISTHQVKDLENLIDRIIIIDEGKILFDEDIETITRKLSFRYSYGDAELATALYSESLLKGNLIVAPNEGDDESNLDLELLYKAIVISGDKITKLF